MPVVDEKCANMRMSIDLLRDERRRFHLHENLRVIYTNLRISQRRSYWLSEN